MRKIIPITIKIRSDFVFPERDFSHANFAVVCQRGQENTGHNKSHGENKKGRGIQNDKGPKISRA